MHGRKTKVTWGKESSEGLCQWYRGREWDAASQNGAIHIIKKVDGIEMMKGNEWVAHQIVTLPAVEVQA